MGISKAMAQREGVRRVLCSRRHHGPAAQAALPPGSAMAPAGAFGLRPEWASRVWTDQLAASRAILQDAAFIIGSVYLTHRDHAGGCSSRAANSVAVVAGDVLPPSLILSHNRTTSCPGGGWGGHVVWGSGPFLS